jgi:hypothetical protein
MNKSQLKQLIRECIDEIGKPLPQKNEMYIALSTSSEDDLSFSHTTHKMLAADDTLEGLKSQLRNISMGSPMEGFTVYKAEPVYNFK